MKIFLGTDHAGFKMKEKVKRMLKSLGYEVHDEGAFEFNENDDYPDYIKIVAAQVSSNQDNSRGIIFGGSGQGEAMTANRFPHVRATVYYGGTDEIIRLSRFHNNANILSIGARFVDEEKAEEIIKFWLMAPYGSEERHQRRILKIDNNFYYQNEF